MNPKIQFNICYWLAAFIGLLSIQYFVASLQQVAQVPYSEF